MRTDAQIAASRANGAKSHGPITPEGKSASAANSAFSTGPNTPEGKARVARNAVRHALLSQCLVLPNETAEQFTDLVESLKEVFEPVGDFEERVVENMAAAEWRRRRIWEVETAAIARGTVVSQQAGDELADTLNRQIPATHVSIAMSGASGKSLSLEAFRRYETASSRDLNRNILLLEQLQARRRRGTRESNFSKQSEPSAEPPALLSPSTALIPAINPADD